MKRFTKFSVSTVITCVSLLSFIFPAFGANYNNTIYSTKNNTNYVLKSGSYNTKYKVYTYRFNPNTGNWSIYNPTKPSTPSNPNPAPSNPSTPSTPSPAPSTPSTPPTSSNLSAEESKMVSLVNQERMNQGINPLSVNSVLTTLARQKSQDMVNNNYFSHTSPTYGSPFQMMQKAGVTYKTAGENLAGAQTTASAHQNLMNSPGHRANILNSSFTEIGIGVISGSAYGNIYTQMFIGR